MVSLAPLERRRRARRLRLVVTDCDGVLTDGGVYYSAAGEELRRFSVRDGMGVERLREAGVETAILTRESWEGVARRGEKLRLNQVFLGVRDKAAFLETLTARVGLDLDAVAYIGDDVNDLEALTVVGRAGLTAAPADAEAPVREAVHYRCAREGGHGAFREFAEWILDLRRHGRLEEAI
jgi:3-deoxy-D-manno-octulosonate 8-phosphate phosphatase (KDO 8-P phosphatase)